MIPLDPMTVATTVAPVALDIAKKQFQKYFSRDHGSKVKMGEFAEATIEMYGDKACIKLNENGSKVLLLTSDTIHSYRFIEEKFHISRMKDYYYYDITFKDGSTSYVRMSEKYRDAMLRYT